MVSGLLDTCDVLKTLQCELLTSWKHRQALSMQNFMSCLRNQGCQTEVVFGVSEKCSVNGIGRG